MVTVNEFEQKGQELTRMMIELCEMQYASTKGSQVHKADAMAKCSLSVVAAIKAFSAAAKLSDE